MNPSRYRDEILGPRKSARFATKSQRGALSDYTNVEGAVVDLAGMLVKSPVRSRKSEENLCFASFAEEYSFVERELFPDEDVVSPLDLKDNEQDSLLFRAGVAGGSSFSNITQDVFQTETEPRIHAVFVPTSLNQAYLVNRNPDYTHSLQLHALDNAGNEAVGGVRSTCVSGVEVGEPVLTPEFFDLETSCNERLVKVLGKEFETKIEENARILLGAQLSEEGELKERAVSALVEWYTMHPGNSKYINMAALSRVVTNEDVQKFLMPNVVTSLLVGPMGEEYLWFCLLRRILYLETTMDYCSQNPSMLMRTLWKDFSGMRAYLASYGILESKRGRVVVLDYVPTKHEFLRCLKEYQLVIAWFPLDAPSYLFEQKYEAFEWCINIQRCDGTTLLMCSLHKVPFIFSTTGEDQLNVARIRYVALSILRPYAIVKNLARCYILPTWRLFLNQHKPAISYGLPHELCYIAPDPLMYISDFGLIASTVRYCLPLKVVALDRCILLNEGYNSVLSPHDLVHRSIRTAGVMPSGEVANGYPEIVGWKPKGNRPAVRFGERELNIVPFKEYSIQSQSFRFYSEDLYRVACYAMAFEKSMRGTSIMGLAHRKKVIAYVQNQVNAVRGDDWISPCSQDLALYLARMLNNAEEAPVTLTVLQRGFDIKVGHDRLNSRYSTPGAARIAQRMWCPSVRELTMTRGSPSDEVNMIPVSYAFVADNLLRDRRLLMRNNLRSTEITDTSAIPTHLTDTVLSFEYPPDYDDLIEDRGATQREIDETMDREYRINPEDFIRDIYTEHVDRLHNMVID